MFMLLNVWKVILNIEVCINTYGNRNPFRIDFVYKCYKYVENTIYFYRLLSKILTCTDIESRLKFPIIYLKFDWNLFTHNFDYLKRMTPWTWKKYFIKHLRIQTQFKSCFTVWIKFAWWKINNDIIEDQTRCNYLFLIRRTYAWQSTIKKKTLKCLIHYSTNPSPFKSRWFQLE